MEKQRGGGGDRKQKKNILLSKNQFARFFPDPFKQVWVTLQKHTTTRHTCI